MDDKVLVNKDCFSVQLPSGSILPGCETICRFMPVKGAGVLRGGVQLKVS